MKLRDYQQGIIDDLLSWFYANPTGNPIVGACVGAGKSVMIGYLCKLTQEEWTGQRVLMLAPTKELVEQNYQKAVAMLGADKVGIHCAGLKRKDTEQPIIFATIGSIYKKAFDMAPFTIGMVDECHNIPTKDQGMYRKYLDDMKVANPYFRLIGWTGTPYRGNGVFLWSGESPIFSGIAAQVTMSQLLKRGYLAPLSIQPTATHIDTSAVKMSGGDFVASELAKVVDVPEVVESAVAEVVKAGQDRRSWLVYAANIQHAEHIKQALERHGVPTGIVHQDSEDRDGTIAKFKRFELRALVNVAVLTTGFDHPATDLIALMRPTRSPVLYVQIAGRGMRTDPQKTDCLWLDFSDSTEVLGPVDLVSGRESKGKRGGEAPQKACPECAHIQAAGVRKCASCGYEFPMDFGSSTHGTRAGTAAVLAEQIKPETLEVTGVTYARHRKAGKPDSVKVTYQCGLNRFVNEWVAFSGGGYARARASEWWRQRSAEPMPLSTDDALLSTGQLLKPAKIEVMKSGKYDTIRRCHFDAVGAPAAGRPGNESPAAVRATPAAAILQTL